MKLNRRKIGYALLDAGIANSGIGETGEIWDVDGVTDISKRPDVMAILKEQETISDVEESLEDRIRKLENGMSRLDKVESSLAAIEKRGEK